MERSIPLDEMVRVRNNSPSPLRLGYNSRVYTVPPNGGESFIPCEAAVIHFGDWEARNDLRGERRREEVLRIKGLYGALPGMKREHGEQTFTDGELWERNRPEIELMTMDGKPIATVIDDPDGTHLPDPTPSMDRDTLIAELLARQERQQKMIDDLLSSQGPTDVETDRYETAPRPRRKQVAIEPAEREQADTG